MKSRFLKEYGTYIYSQLIFDKGANGEKTVILINGAEMTRYSHAEKMKLGPYLTPYIYINVNSKWLIELNVRVKIIKLLEEK